MQKKLIILVLFVFSLASYAQEADRNGFIVKVGDQAPDFSTQLSNGKTFQLSEQKGKIVMLQFTASWCSVCRKEMPYIEKDIWQVLKVKKFVLIGVDRDEPMDVILKYEKQMGISYPLALDPKADIFSLYAKLLSGVTRNVIIDANGKIIYMSRLFKLDDFHQMTDVIKTAVAKLD